VQLSAFFNYILLSASQQYFSLTINQHISAMIFETNEQACPKNMHPEVRKKEG
jgi:hypothetical protein